MIDIIMHFINLQFLLLFLVDEHTVIKSSSASSHVVDNSSTRPQPVHTLATIITSSTSSSINDTHNTVSLPLSTNRPCVSILKSIRLPHTTNSLRDKLTDTMSSRTTATNAHRVQPPATTSLTLKLSLQTSQGQLANSIPCGVSDGQLNAPDAALAKATTNVANNRQPSVVSTASSMDVDGASVKSQSRKCSLSNSTTFMLASRNDQIVLVDKEHVVCSLQEQSSLGPTKSHQIPMGMEDIGSVKLGDRGITATLANASGSVDTYQFKNSTLNRLLRDGKPADSIQTSIDTNNSLGITVKTVASSSSTHGNGAKVEEPVILSQRSTKLANLPAKQPKSIDTQITSHNLSALQFQLDTVESHVHNLSNASALKTTDPSYLSFTQHELSNSILSNTSVLQPNSKQLSAESKHFPLQHHTDDDYEIISESTEDHVTSKEPIHFDNRSGSSSEHSSSSISSRQTDEVKTLVNGLVSSSSDSCEIDSFDTLKASLPISSSDTSCTNLALDVQTAASGPITVSISTLPSPGQQRKSGRMRTIRSPDPDYVTPNKG